jgi:Flp pilus assembly pilin Flp
LHSAIRRYTGQDGKEGRGDRGRPTLRAAGLGRGDEEVAFLAYQVGRLLAAAREDSGATAVEYALMLALIAMVVFGGVLLLGHSTNNSFNSFSFTPP